MACRVFLLPRNLTTLNSYKAAPQIRTFAPPVLGKDNAGTACTRGGTYCYPMLFNFTNLDACTHGKMCEASEFSFDHNLELLRLPSYIHSVSA